MIYGDGIITPAISVLSAVEGLNVATNVFKPHIVPIAVGILLALFAVQSRGTAKDRGIVRAGDAAVVHNDRGFGSRRCRA